ncbi:hypothetical protein HPB50_019454 [Hyalomma asiaticum]|uniref:Uncharacterized protein n=1 Tax=Hyalomma asiaticum TaxID=266040 RepID=A0ACB7TAN9_HYAAI|nr:hypothetical protein HPB50_019454 [Hyalomma asiaticum]
MADLGSDHMIVEITAPIQGQMVRNIQEFRWTDWEEFRSKRQALSSDDPITDIEEWTQLLHTNVTALGQQAVIDALIHKYLPLGPPVTHADYCGDCLNDDSGEPDDAQKPPPSGFKRLCVGARNQCCSLQRWKNRVPIVKWLPHYSLLDLHGDFVAGMTVALTVIPQGLALAVLAGLPPQYGLYTAFMGSFMYTIFGSCKDLTIGPTAIMSIMTGEYTHLGGPTFAVILTFLSGIIQVLMGLLNLGFIVEFISGPVISGFTSAAAITIASTQLKSLFGMKFEAEEFLDTMYQFFTHLHTMRLADSLLGVSCVILLLLIRHFKDVKFSPDSRLPPRVQKVIEGVWWTFATARNAIAVLVCAVAAAILLSNNMQPFALTDEVKGGMPPFQLPNFTADIFDTSSNKTIHMNFLDIMRTLGAGIPIIALLSILESVAIAKAFAKGKSLDSTQEMLAIGQEGNALCQFWRAALGVLYSTKAAVQRTNQLMCSEGDSGGARRNCHRRMVSGQPEEAVPGYNDRGTRVRIVGSKQSVERRSPIPIG